MKIRRDAVAVSSILFTVALLMQTPAMWNAAWTMRESGFWVSGTHMMKYNCYSPMGFASLAVIAVGLIVTWAGYFKGVRWTWFVMFVIVWLWAFPVLMMPFFYPWNTTASIAQSYAAAVSGILRAQPGSDIYRIFVEVTLVFLLMVLALVLPVKTFFSRRGVAQADPGART